MKENLLKYPAQFILRLFNPYLIPTLGLFAIMNYIPGVEFFSAKLKIVIMGVFFLSTCFIPLLFIALGNLNRVWGKGAFQFVDKVMPKIYTALCTFLGAQFLGKFPIPGIFRILLLGFCLIIIFSIVISIKWKISEYTLALGGLWGALVALNMKYGMNILWLIIGVILIAGIIGSSSIYMEKDSPNQVYGGFLAGTLGMFILLVLI